MSDDEPTGPSLRSTLIATGVAFLVASVVLVAAIMPAEYGIDPTGIGAWAGWNALSEEPEPTEPLLPNATSSRELLRFNVTWPESTSLVLEDAGRLNVGASATLDMDLDAKNVTALTAILSWTDEAIAGQQTEPDTFEVTVAPPTGQARSWLGRNEGPAGTIDAHYLVATPPQGDHAVAEDEKEARSILESRYPGAKAGTGTWRIEIRLQDAGGLGVVPDDGNDWSLRVFASTYAMQLGEAQETGIREDTFEVVVPARDGVESKVFVMEGDSFQYTWDAPVELYYDFHGVRGDGEEISHETATASHREADFIAPFNGRHGWYWQNDGVQDVTVTLRLLGTYRP